jgi:hypothetical protein
VSAACNGIWKSSCWAVKLASSNVGFWLQPAWNSITGQSQGIAVLFAASTKSRWTGALPVFRSAKDLLTKRPRLARGSGAHFLFVARNVDVPARSASAARAPASFRYVSITTTSRESIRECVMIVMLYCTG